MKALATFLLCAAPLLAGCLNATTVINVNADGAGTIEQTMLMNKQALAQLSQMGGFGQAGAAKGGLFDEQTLRNAAPALGEGVTFVSATPMTTPDSEGARAVYAFQDITKLRMSQKPATAGGGAVPIPGGSATEDLLFRFAKTPGGNPRVTVLFPEAARKAAQGQAGGAGQTPNAADPMQAAAMAMIRPMLNGLKISIALQPAGRIVKTNSPFVQGQQVTLLELDLGQVLADEATMQKLQGAASLEEMKAALKGVKGAKINPDREVSVEFAPKPAPATKSPRGGR